MRTPHHFVVVVIISLIVAAVVMLPRRGEQAAMLAGEGRHKEAIALMERRLADAPGDPDLLAALGRSYAAVGETGRAIATLDAYLAVRPSDLTARRRQAELLLHTGSIDRYLDAMAGVVAAQPSPREVTGLIELYRLHGRVEDEIATLQAYAGTTMLETAQLERLGALLAERGRWPEARQALESADRKAPPDASAGRFLLLEVLIQSNEADRAYERAQAWMKAWRSAFLSGRLILRMAQAGLTVPAYGLAFDFTDMMPDDTFGMVGLFAQKGRKDLAHQMLVRWADRMTEPTGKQLREFVQASALAGDVGGPLAKLVQLARSGSSPATQGQLAEEVAKAFGPPALVAVRPLLSNEALLARPLFASELSLFEGNREMARWFLDRIEPERLSPEETTNWLAMLHRVETDADVFQRLAALWNQRRLPLQLVPYLSDEAAKLGHARTHDLIWNSMRQQSTANLAR